MKAIYFQAKPEGMLDAPIIFNCYYIITEGLVIYNRQIRQIMDAFSIEITPPAREYVGTILKSIGKDIALGKEPKENSDLSIISEPNEIEVEDELLMQLISNTDNQEELSETIREDLLKLEEKVDIE